MDHFLTGSLHIGIMNGMTIFQNKPGITKATGNGTVGTGVTGTVLTQDTEAREMEAGWAQNPGGLAIRPVPIRCLLPFPQSLQSYCFYAFTASHSGSLSLSLCPEKTLSSNLSSWEQHGCKPPVNVTGCRAHLELTFHFVLSEPQPTLPMIRALR